MIWVLTVRLVKNTQQGPHAQKRALHAAVVDYNSPQVNEFHNATEMHGSKAPPTAFFPMVPGASEFFICCSSFIN